MRYGYGWWKTVMLNRRHVLMRAMSRQASKSSPTRLSEPVVKSEKGIYRREKYPSVAYLRKRMVALIKAKS
jgi:hypothetical protein